MTQTRRAERTSEPVAAFRSILFGEHEPDLEAACEPGFFSDLNLDQVVEAVLSGRDRYELRPFFYLPLRDADAVEYRHEVFRELERGEVWAAVEGFAAEVRRVRRRLGLVEEQHYRYEQQRWLLDAAVAYCDAVAGLAEALAGLELESRGFRGLSGYLEAYTGSQRFRSLDEEARRVFAGLDGVRYSLRIKGGRVTVTAYEGEPDYSVEVEETFARFRQGDVEDHLVKIRDPGSMDHVEAQIVRLVARLFPREFRALDAFAGRHRHFLDPVVTRFDREVQLCLAYLEHAGRVEAAGARFGYPEVSTGSKETAVEGGCDLALATKLAVEGGRVVRNGFALSGAERTLVVTGPNQGGKTTFARMFGQLHYLAGLGVPVPAERARLFLPDRVYTHFEREEDVTTLRGKLDDELVRVREILEQATEAGVIVLNDVFSATTLEDAVFLGREVLGRIAELGCLAVCVTFIDELASLGEATASMVAGVDPADPSRRTFEIVRRPADGRAYAAALASKYGLSYEQLKERLGR